MTLTDVIYACLGAGALLAAVLPRLVARRPVSMPLIFLLCGGLLYLLPTGLPRVDPVGDRLWVQHATEMCVIISLMGAGLALNRPFGRRSWSATWRLLGITMPLSVAATAALAWGMDWPPAVALLIAAVLAPTDPVLASEVRVGAPTDSEHDEDEVRFALTSEAGLNDGLAFPVVHAAIALAAAAGAGWSGSWIGEWVLVDVVYRCAVGVIGGLVVGRLLGWMFFRTNWEALRLSEHREGFVALGATFLSYGVVELVHGYGFLAVFLTACSVRAAERAHGYHVVLHEFIEQVERLLTAALLFLAGGYIATGGLAALTWRGAVLALVAVFVIRPLTGWLAQLGSAAGPRERVVTAFFGIRGIGSLFYLAYALGTGDFLVSDEEMWAVVTFAVVVSVVVHGIAATPVITRLDRLRRRRERRTARSSGTRDEPAQQSLSVPDPGLSPAWTSQARHRVPPFPAESGRHGSCPTTAFAGRGHRRRPVHAVRLLPRAEPRPSHRLRPGLPAGPRPCPAAGPDPPMRAVHAHRHLLTGIGSAVPRHCSAGSSLPPAVAPDDRRPARPRPVAPGPRRAPVRVVRLRAAGGPAAPDPADAACAARPGRSCAW